MTLNYKTLGYGKPLVILHGLLGSLDNWVTVSKYLSKSYKIYIIDLQWSNEFEQNAMITEDEKWSDMSDIIDASASGVRLNQSVLVHPRLVIV